MSLKFLGSYVNCTIAVNNDSLADAVFVSPVEYFLRFAGIFACSLQILNCFKDFVYCVFIVVDLATNIVTIWLCGHPVSPFW